MGTQKVGDSKSAIPLTAAQAIVKYLQAQWSERDGVKRRVIPRLFGIFGHGNVVGLGQALEEYGAELPYCQCKNEEMMVHAASGYAKACNRLSTFACSASIGPGSTNMVTGAAAATANRLPVLLLPSDTFATRSQGVVLQQIEPSWTGDLTVNDCLRPVSRYFDRIERPEQLLTALPAAIRALLDQAETGAVTLSLPQDVQGEAFPYPSHFFEPRTWSIVRRPPASAEIAAAVQMISAAKRPIVIAGGGVRYSEAEAALADFARRTGMIVVETHAGKGVMTVSELALGAVGVNGTAAANAMANEADLVICIGTRLSDFITGSNSLFQHPKVRFLGLNVSGADAAKMGALTVVADARESLVALSQALQARGYRLPEHYAAEAAERRTAWRQAVAAETAPGQHEKMTQAQVVLRLNQLSHPNDIVVTAAGSIIADVTKLWDCENHAACHIEFGYSCMGFDIPSAIGLRMARLDAGEIYVMIGDGNYLLANSELLTAVQERIKITVILIENEGFQSIHSLQMAKTGTGFGNERRMRNPADNRLTGEVATVDFVAHARSLGCQAVAVDTLEAFEAAVGAARNAADRPFVIVTCVEPHRMFAADNGCWWDVGVAQTSKQPRVNRATEQHLQTRRAVQRSYH
jgi:3D-(3,5/4)-trihydroxycyclohexane-1,2-dione acylhydrolase (decyclizing)